MHMTMLIKPKTDIILLFSGTKINKTNDKIANNIKNILIDRSGTKLISIISSLIFFSEFS